MCTWIYTHKIDIHVDKYKINIVDNAHVHSHAYTCTLTECHLLAFSRRSRFMILSFSSWYSTALSMPKLCRDGRSANCLYSFERFAITLAGLPTLIVVLDVTAALGDRAVAIAVAASASACATGVYFFLLGVLPPAR